MVQSGRISGKGRIRASIEKLFGLVPKKGPINVSTEKWKNPGEYQEKVESVRASKNYPSGYRKRVDLVSVLKNGRIRESIEKQSGRVLEKGRISVCTEKC